MVWRSPTGTPVVGKKGRSGPPGHMHAMTHGSRRAEADVKLLRRRALDPDSEEGREVLERFESFLPDLGGAEALTAVSREAVRVLSLEGFIIERFAAWLFEHRAPFDDEKGRAIPGVIEFSRLLDRYFSHLQAIGFERRAKPVIDLEEYLTKRSNGTKGTQDATESAQAPEAEPEASSEPIDAQRGAQDES